MSEHKLIHLEKLKYRFEIETFADGTKKYYPQYSIGKGWKPINKSLPSLYFMSSDQALIAIRSHRKQLRDNLITDVIYQDIDLNEIENAELNIIQ